MTNSRGDRRWKNRPLIRERDAQRARWLWLILAGVIAALAPAGIYLYEQNSCLQLSYEIESIEAQRKDLAEVERRLAVSHAGVASMQSTERWARRARFERPEGNDIIVVPHEAPINAGILTNASVDPVPNRQRRGE